MRGLKHCLLPWLIAFEEKLEIQITTLQEVRNQFLKYFSKSKFWFGHKLVVIESNNSKGLY